MKYILIFLCFCTAELSAQTTSRFFDLADNFFEQYVDNGRVKYAEIQQNPKALNELLAEAKSARVNPETPEHYQAFWINAYNIAVIAGIVQNYPVASPMEIDGFFDKIKYSLGQQSVTLDQIEHEILFGSFPEEERFHFALVCAAKSCPPLINKAYRPETLEQQLQDQTERALNDPSFVREEDNMILFSEIMKWYKEDFTTGGKSLIEYTNQFRKIKIPVHYEVGYYGYNWELNE